MGVSTVLATVLFTMVAISLVMNLLQLATDSRKLKAEGKTPLTGRNIATITLAAIAEALTVYLLMKIVGTLDIKYTVPFVASMFLLVYIIRNGAAYVVAWILWSIFVKVDSKRLKKELDQESGGAI